MLLSPILRHYWHLVLHKAYADFRAEAERTYLGVLWWVLEPLVDMIIYWLVFGYFLGRGDGDFVPFLLVGLVAWRYFNVTVLRASNSILVNVNMVRQLSFRKIIFPLIALVTCSMEFVFSLLLLFGFLFYWGYQATPHWAAFPILLAVEVLFILAFALPLSAFVPLVPDLQKLMTYVLRIAFYMSGILYNVSDLPETAQTYLRWNPAIVVIDGYRDILMYGRWPNWAALGMVAAGSTALACIGVFFLFRFDMLFAKRITR